MSKAARTVTYQVASAVEGTDFNQRMEAYLRDVPGHLLYSDHVNDYLALLANLEFGIENVKKVYTVLKAFPECKANLREKKCEKLEQLLLQKILSFAELGLQSHVDPLVKTNLVELLAEAMIVWPLQGKLHDYQSELARILREGQVEQSLNKCKALCQKILDNKDSADGSFLESTKELVALQPQSSWKPAASAQLRELLEKTAGLVLSKMPVLLAGQTAPEGADAMAAYSSCVELLAQCLGDEKGRLNALVQAGIDLQTSRRTRAAATVSVALEYRQLLSAEKTAGLNLLEAAKLAGEAKIVRSLAVEPWKKMAGASKSDLVKTLEAMKKDGNAELVAALQKQGECLACAENWNLSSLATYDEVVANAAKTLMAVDPVASKHNAAKIEEVTCGDVSPSCGMFGM